MKLSTLRLLCKKKFVRTHQTQRKQVLIHNTPVDDQQCLISEYQVQEGKQSKSERKVSCHFGAIHSLADLIPSVMTTPFRRLLGIKKLCRRTNSRILRHGMPLKTLSLNLASRE